MTRTEKLVTTFVVMCLLLGYVIVGSHLETNAKVQTVSGAK